MSFNELAQIGFYFLVLLALEFSLARSRSKFTREGRESVGRFRRVKWPQKQWNPPAGWDRSILIGFLRGTAPALPGPPETV